jgi:PPK2 family polyphosphate:nucleotide phosphotransferase
MNTRALFRLPKKYRVRDEDASAKPLSSGDKAVDKSVVETLSQEIAAQQDIFYAEHKRKILIVLQGMDTAGKDGTIRAVFQFTDPLGIRTIAFKAPSTVEKEHDFLWRIHWQVPAQGEIVIFNRSHYEDVLVPRVHRWIDEHDCKLRYANIRDFERMLSETGTTIIKFFLHISKDEQRGRLQARLDDPQKHWKFDPQDLEERKLWDEYRDAYTEMLQETDAEHAPWYVIPADSKTHRNLAIASVIKETLAGMELAYPEPRADYAGLKVE